MRRSEALQGVRMIRFRSVLGRYEADELDQIEAAEVPREGERIFRGWRRSSGPSKRVPRTTTQAPQRYGVEPCYRSW